MNVIDIMKDFLKVIDYLKIGLPHHMTSYFCWGGGGIKTEHLHRRREEIEIEIEAEIEINSIIIC